MADDHAHCLRGRGWGGRAGVGLEEERHGARSSGTLSGAAAEEERTSAHKINGGVQYRSPFGLDLALDIHLASEQTWVQAISSATSGSDVGIFRVPGYAIVNARIGYRLFDDALELAVIGNNLASTPFRQHPFAQKISRRIFGSATLRF